MGGIISTDPLAICATEPTKEIDTTCWHQVVTSYIKNLELLGKWNLEDLFQDLFSSVSEGQFEITYSLHSFLTWCDIYYPLFKDVPKDVWLKTDADPTGRIYQHSDTPVGPVQLSYFNAEVGERDISSKDGYPIPQEFAETYHVFYHATDRASAENIIEKGIDLNKGRPHQDFSTEGGFYLATDYGVAIKRADQKKRKSRGETAVLIFLVNKELFKKFNGKQLLDELEWQDVIQFNRRGKGDGRVYKRKYRGFDYLEGTICSNGGDVAQFGASPETFGQRDPEYQQLCVLSRDMAKCIGDIRHIAVIFRQ